MSATDREAKEAIERMRRRRELITASRRHFEALPEASKRAFREGLLIADQDAKTVIRRGYQWRRAV